MKLSLISHFNTDFLIPKKHLQNIVTFLLKINTTGITHQVNFPTVRIKQTESSVAPGAELWRVRTGRMS